MAREPSGTTRSLFPLPTHRANPVFRSRSTGSSPTTSEARQPVAYKVSKQARSRRPSRVSERGDSSRRSTAAGLKTVGKRSQTAGATSSLATLSAEPALEDQKAKEGGKARQVPAHAARRQTRAIERLDVAAQGRYVQSSPAGPARSTYASGQTA